MNTDLLLIARIGFALLTVIYLILFIREIKRGIENTNWDPLRKRRIHKIIVFSLLIWMSFVSIWSRSGIMADFSIFPLNFFPVIGPALLASLVLLFSKTWADILRHIPVERFIRLQHFRIFVEVLLWALFAASVLPVQMTFEGRNFDILSGLTAPLIAWLTLRKKISKTGLILWNVVCLCILINIIAIAILSTPSPIRVFMNEPANTIVTLFPVSWLPGFLAPFAFALHVFSLKQLLMKTEINRTVVAQRV
jgi:hypothetical protein